MNIGKRLKQLRLDKGWSQAKIAALFGVDSPATISHYESGLRSITVETLTTYANIFDMTVQELIAPVDFGEKINERKPIPFD